MVTLEVSRYFLEVTREKSLDKFPICDKVGLKMLEWCYQSDDNLKAYSMKLSNIFKTFNKGVCDDCIYARINCGYVIRIYQLRNLHLDKGVRYANI